jgi:hypothetical protein
VKRLHISDDLALPIDAVTSTLVVYGGKGMGKTNLGSVIMEELYAAGQRFAVIDPMGVWWGLRHSEDGKGLGIEVLILGGIHGDIPIEPTAGSVVADLVVDEDVSVVIDISRRPDGTMWSIAERIRFVTDYTKRLYQRQGEQRRPLMAVYDEAARFIPQTIRKGDDAVAFCVGAIAVLVEEGRNVGVGVTLITQRSARLNKDVAELADIMIAFRTVGPNSRAAVLDWLGEHIEKERIRDLDAQLRSLPVGSALVVSPGWLAFEGVVRFRHRQTFDSSATPKPGQSERKVRGAGAKPDLEKYQVRMAETIERAAENDPKQIRKKFEVRIVQLERDLKAAQSAKQPAVIDEREIERRMKIRLDDETRHLKQQLAQRDERLATMVANAKDELLHVVKALGVKFSPGPAPKRDAAKVTMSIDHGPARQVTSMAAARAIAESRVPRPLQQRSSVTIAPNGGPTGALRRIMVALAQHPEGLSYRKIGVFSGVSTKGGSFGTYLSTGRRNGWIAGDDKSGVKITSEGVEALGSFEPLPTGRDLVSYWIREFGSGKTSQILRVIADAWPSALSDEEIEVAADVSTKGGSYGTYLSTLRTRDVIVDITENGVRKRKLSDELAED